MCCPKCQGEMKIVALIDCPGLIRRILEHLNLWEPINRMICPRSPPIEEFPEAHLGAWKGICFQVIIIRDRLIIT